MDNCEVKTRTVITQNVTISALTHKHAGYVVFPARTFTRMKMDRFLNWKVSAYMNWALVELARSETRYEITNPPTKKALTQSSCRQLTD